MKFCIPQSNLRVRIRWKVYCVIRWNFHWAWASNQLRFNTLALTLTLNKFSGCVQAEKGKTHILGSCRGSGHKSCRGVYGSALLKHSVLFVFADTAWPSCSDGVLAEAWLWKKEKIPRWLVGTESGVVKAELDMHPPTTPPPTQWSPSSRFLL